MGAARSMPYTNGTAEGHGGPMPRGASAMSKDKVTTCDPRSRTGSLVVPGLVERIRPLVCY